ncbi:MAG: phytanoyl-CoA dioxygenase family protein [Chitinophagales bacterium]|nr:phytanoyl-CoA dioxygenase family protein [Chitinophagales bacterium]
MKRQVFRDAHLNTQFLKDGHVLYAHNTQDIGKKLQEAGIKYQDECTHLGFNTTHFSFNKAYKKEIAEMGIELFNEYFTHLFIDYKVLFSNLMIKTPGSDALLPVHADWAYVDETQYTAISIWMPAIQTDYENGAFGIIPHSHQLAEKMRGPEIVSSYRKYDNLLKEKRGKLLPIGNKEAIIYDLRLLHYSLPNTTNQTRIAINIVIVPKEAEIFHYSFLNNKICKYKHLDNTFFLNYHAHQIPEQVQADEEVEYLQQICDEEIIHYYHLEEEKVKKSYLEKVMQFIKR